MACIIGGIRYFTNTPFNYLLKRMSIEGDQNVIESISFSTTNNDKIRYNNKQLEELKIIQDINNYLWDLDIEYSEIEFEFQPDYDSFIIYGFEHHSKKILNNYCFFADNIFSIKKINDIQTEIIFKSSERLILPLPIETFDLWFEKILLSNIKKYPGNSTLPKKI